MEVKNILSTYEPKKHLPVHISQSVMEMITESGDLQGCYYAIDGETQAVFVEIGECRTSTPENVICFLNENFDGLLELAWESDCELLEFSV